MMTEPCEKGSEAKSMLAKNHSEHLAERLTAIRGQFTRALMLGDAQGAARAVDDLIAGRSSLLDIYVQVLAPALATVGDSWCAGEIGVGEEHLATEIAIEQMNRLRALFVVAEPRSPYRVLVACVEGERHSVGARMAADLCLLRGWAVDFLGADAPTDSVVEMARQRRSQLVALSMTIPQGKKHLPRLVEALAALTPPPSLVLGGQLFGADPLSTETRRGCVIARDAAEGIELIGRLLRADRPKAALKEFLLSLGRRVRALRSRKGWTQEQLAEASQVTRVCIVAVEGGKQNVSMDILVRLATALGVAPEVLLAGEDKLVDVARREA